MKTNKKGFIVELDDNEVIIVGTNLNGEHFGGAAKQAYEQFGLEWGVGEGLSGNSYAFPTLDKNMFRFNKSALERRIVLLKRCCEQNSKKTFYLTRVGCGIAGFTDEYMFKLFKSFQLPSNLILPGEWK